MRLYSLFNKKSLFSQDQVLRTVHRFLYTYLFDVGDKGRQSGGPTGLPAFLINIIVSHYYCVHSFGQSLNWPYDGLHSLIIESGFEEVSGSHPDPVSQLL